MPRLYSSHLPSHLSPPSWWWCHPAGDEWGDQTWPDMLFTVGCSLNNHPIFGGNPHYPRLNRFHSGELASWGLDLDCARQKAGRICYDLQGMSEDWLSMVPWDFVFDAQSLAQCGHAPSPTPSPRDHSPHRRLWASQSLPGSGIFDFTERYRKLMSTMVSCSSQISMDSFFIICLFFVSSW